jgi:hypothetical protein
MFHRVVLIVPPRQNPASFSLDQVMEKMTTARIHQN